MQNRWIARPAGTLRDYPGHSPVEGGPPRHLVGERKSVHPDFFVLLAKARGVRTTASKS